MKNFLIAFVLCMIAGYLFLFLSISNLLIYLAGSSLVVAGFFTAYLGQSVKLEELEKRIQKLEHESAGDEKE